MGVELGTGRDFGWYTVYRSYHPNVLRLRRQAGSHYLCGVSVPLIFAGIANWMSGPGPEPTDIKLNSLTLTLFILSEAPIFFGMFIAYYFLRINAGRKNGLGHRPDS